MKPRTLPKDPRGPAPCTPGVYRIEEHQLQKKETGRAKAPSLSRMFARKALGFLSRIALSSLQEEKA